MNDKHRKWLERHHEDGREILAEINRLEAAEREWKHNYDQRNKDAVVLEDAANAVLIRAEKAEAERDDLKRRWEEDNLCGICPYRSAIQKRVTELERTLATYSEEDSWADLEHARAENHRLREFYEAFEEVERGTIDFDLQHKQVERLEAARRALQREGYPKEYME